ncbi:MAG TPA: hydrogenase maturation peptidase HycI [Bacillota bacterium]|nr:hydrogenase maturation peptidase HycI [Bacillota bacterium]HOK69458.1 hydrogenase maturation peptidase HycI [Bacillota bacterium]HPP86054.1 hydrogenase maturation peptidase HycI [Bacillota bacterium]
MNLASFITEKTAAHKKIAVLGVGSVLRSDDAAGMYLIEKLQELANSENLLLIAGSTAPENFTGVIKDFDPDILFIVDAAKMGLEPGEIRVLDTDDAGGLSFSTHMLPLPVMLRFLQREAGCEIVCIGIQPQSTEFGSEMSEAVKSAVESLAQTFAQSFRKNNP